MNDKFIENMSVKLKEGRLPENDTELAISTRINEKFNTNYKVGDTITLNINETEQNMENGIPKTYKIVGIIERPILAIESYYVDWFTAITKMQNVNKKANIAVLYNKPKDYIKNTENINNMTKTENNEDGVSFSGLSNKYKSYKYNLMVNKELLAYEGASLDDETLKTIYGLGAFIIGIVLVSSVFVIRNGFEISITERLKQYGMLSSIGATKKQIKKSVYFEGFILGLIGIPLGIISGVFAIYILVNVVNYILKDYISKGTLLTYSMSWIAIAISVFVSIITIWLSCKKSAKKASKVSPIEAIRNSEDVKLKAKKVKCPKIITKIFKTGGEIAYKNLKRSKKKYRTTVISIIVSVSIFIAMNAFVQYAIGATSVYYKDYDYNLVVNGKEEDTNQLLELAKNDTVKKYSIIRELSVKVPKDAIEKHYTNEKKVADESVGAVNTEGNEEYIMLVAVGKDEYMKILNKNGLKYEDVKNKVILNDSAKTYISDKQVYSMYRIYDYKKGDYISAKTENKSIDLEIAAITDTIPMGLQSSYYSNGMFIISDEFFDEYKEKNDRRINLYLDSSNPNELEEIAKKSSACNYVENIEIIAKEQNAMWLVISIFLYGFIAVISLIGVTNIFNTITTNMELRQKEFANLKSIGMTKKEFNRMIRLESVLYGGKALIIGIPIGVGLSYLLFKAFGISYEMTYELPFKAIGISIVVVAILIWVVMRFSLKKINKQNIIETIRKDNI